MPELPEVETIRRDLSSALNGVSVTAVTYDTPKMLKPSPEAVVKALTGQKIRNFDRIAKLLLIVTDTVTAAIHLKLSGQLLIRNQSDPAEMDKYTHVTLKFDNGRELRFNEMRKFGFIKVLESKEDVDKLLDGYGPEPLSESFTPEALGKALLKSTRPIKTTILDQTKIAGVGNIYADEALWYARIHPERAANSLTKKEIEELYKDINFVIKQGITDGGTSDADYIRIDGSKGTHSKNLKVFRQQKKPCERCGTIIEKIFVGGRGTHFCPSCQRNGTKKQGIKSVKK